MNIIEPSFKILEPLEFTREALLHSHLEVIEDAARTCYKSEGKAVPGKAGEFVRKIGRVFKHESVLEHSSVTVKFITDRGVSHELVRHRLAAYSQESTRYCNYGKGNEITVINPPFFESEDQAERVRYAIWYDAMLKAEEAYLTLLENGASPQEARSVLPNSLKTEIVMTTNFREWRHVLKLRTSPQAHPQMRQLMIPLLNLFKEVLPEIFDDINEDDTRNS